ncbi:DUF2971 domain-containing protein [Morganella psychrotolerans]|uniref:DUF2971 domain-containing protein n=1 Tax=Morganella psychrotolerans TaxID=368603 RepID=A0A1B8HQX4_9GAMM|nr:DUF2971 domain-containing protein [Morganella psychrotolerans]OBU11891.1 hypothetical protein AYY18_17565 [Morganella psychrotolerans]
MGKPSYVGHYADNHKGIALGFDIKNNNLTEVDYIDNLNKYDKSNMSPIEMESMKTSLKNSKFSQWKYENESRLTLKLNECDNEGDLYFYSLDKINLKEIIVGANCQIDLKIIKKLIDNIRPKDNINIIKARIAFTEFKITKDKIKTKNGLK